ncbi:MAG: response regulator transcription factor [Pseudonocardiaceae bacterium]
MLDAKIKAALLPLRGRNRLGEDLTAIETETLRLMVEGHTNKTIADIFGLSEKTIAMRCTAIFDKLGFADPEGSGKRNRRVAAVVHYIKNLEKYRRIWETPPIGWPPPTSQGANYDQV